MATEEERILSIKVDYAEAVNKIADYKDKLDELKFAEKAYKDELKKGLISQEEYTKRMIASKAAASEYKTAVNVLEKQLNSQVKTQKTNADIMADVNGLLGKNATSVAGAEAANKALREAVRNLSDEEEGAYELRQKLNAQIDDNTNYIKRNSDEYIKQKMTIGDYKEQFKLAMVELKNGGVTMGSVGIIAKGFGNVLRKDLAGGWTAVTSGANTFIGVLKLVKVAIAATGIGALLIALTSVAAAFTRTQKGMELFQRVTAMIGATIDVVLDRVAMLGTAVVSLFKGDWKGAADAAKGAISGIGDEIKAEVKQADALKKSLIEIEKQETVLAITRSKNRAEIERLKQIAEDTTKTEKERLAAAQAAYAIEKQDMNAQVALQEKRIANMLGFTTVTKEVRQVINDLNRGAMSADEAISKLGLSSSTMTDFKQFADEVVKLNELQESSLTRQIEQNNKINTIKAEINKTVEAGTAEVEKEVKEASGLSDDEFQKEYDRQTRLMQARLAAVESGSKEELELKKKLNEIALNEELEQYADDEEMKLAIKNEYLAKNEELEKAYNEKKQKEQEDRVAKEIEIETEKKEALRSVYNELISFAEAVGESNRALAIASKVLALAQIAIDTGKAISAGIASASSVPFPGNLAAIATTIATVLANITTAIKTVKSAKFSTGGDVTGEGTATSDSIPAMLSNGESVMTARATSMFAPILSAFNQAGGGVPIYGQQTGNQAMGEDMLARSFAKGLESMPNPVVSVEEITTVNNRVKVIENLSRI